jgi:hypothetical protein
MNSSLSSRRKNLASIIGLFGAAGLVVAQPQKDHGQPEMHAALDHLRQAKENLEKALHDKGGHRERALDLVNQAMAEVKQGIEFAIRH